MSVSQIEIQLIAVITAAACALPGVILVLRRMSMLSDAISHTVLLGIVIGFFVTEDL
jgi:manganese/zinc/iron transport system permease protein